MAQDPKLPHQNFIEEQEINVDELPSEISRKLGKIESDIEAYEDDDDEENERTWVKTIEKQSKEILGLLKPWKKEQDEAAAKDQEEEEEREKQEKLDADYQAALDQGDKEMEEKNFDLAKEQYEKAAELKPDEQKPKDKIEKVNEAIEDAATGDDDEAYQAALDQGDKELKEKNFDLAKEQYEKAAKLKPDEQEPKDKIAEAEKAKTGDSAGTGDEKKEEPSERKKEKDAAIAKLYESGKREVTEKELAEVGISGWSDLSFGGTVEFVNFKLVSKAWGSDTWLIEKMEKKEPAGATA